MRNWTYDIKITKDTLKIMLEIHPTNRYMSITIILQNTIT